MREDAELRSFFTQENVPESLQVYRPLFVCLDQKQKHSKKVLLLKAFLPPNALFTQRGIAAGILLVIGIAGTQRYLHPTPKIRHYRWQAIHGCKPGA